MISAMRRLDRVIFDHEYYPRLLDRLVGDAESLLDVGCGSASPARLAARRMKRSVGVDGSTASLGMSAASGIHGTYYVTDILTIGEHFDPRSFDVVICSDVIEHLPKEDGYLLLGDMERIAKKRVIVATPNGFLPQPDPDPLQVHRSGWRVWDFEDRGYQVFGFGGLRCLKGPYGLPRFEPRALWWRLSLMTEPLLHRDPGLSFHLLAVKEIAA